MVRLLKERRKKVGGGQVLIQNFSVQSPKRKVGRVFANSDLRSFTVNLVNILEHELLGIK